MSYKRMTHCQRTTVNALTGESQYSVATEDHPEELIFGVRTYHEGLFAVTRLGGIRFYTMHGKLIFVSVNYSSGFIKFDPAEKYSYEVYLEEDKNRVWLEIEKRIQGDDEISEEWETIMKFELPTEGKIIEA